METKSPELVASDVLIAINDVDYGKLDQLTTEDVELRFPPGQLFRGRQRMSEFLHEVQRRLPTLTLVGHHVHTGHDFAVVEYEFQGATAQDVAHDGMGCLVLEFEGGRVHRCTLYLDTMQWQAIGNSI